MLNQNNMKTYTFKPEFEKKLKGVKRKFISNLHDSTIEYVEDFNRECDRLNNEIDFWNFIAVAFMWDKTPEGHEFWEQVSER